MDAPSFTAVKPDDITFMRKSTQKCSDPDHAAINAERKEMRSLRAEWIKADTVNQNLRSWIRENGRLTDTCTYHILGKEICQDCQCGKLKNMALKV